MPIDVNIKLDLVNTDPYFNRTIENGPLPEDEFLWFELGNDYKQYRDMRRDSNVRRLCQKRRQAILGRTMLVESATKKARDALGVQRAEQILRRMRFEALCSSLLNTGQLIGFAVVQIDWDTDGEFVYPTHRFVNQERFLFVHHDPALEGVPVTTDEKLNPETDIVITQGFELRLKTRRAPITGERCPKKRFILYTFDGDGTPWGLGLGYSLYPWWVVKREAMKSWLLQSDRQGSPPTVGTHPPEIKDDPFDTTPEGLYNKLLLRKFESFLKSVSPSGWARLPKDFEANIIDTVGSVGPEVHERLIDMADRQMSYTVLGELSYSDKGTGSYAANESQVDDREASLTDADVNILDEQLDRQLWEPIAELNYSRVTRPIVRRETVADRRKADLEKQKEAQRKERIEHDKALLSMGVKLKEDRIQEIYGDEYELIQSTIFTLGSERTSLLMSFLGSQYSNSGLTFDNAVSVLTNVFGIEEKIAKTMIPEPQEEPTSFPEDEDFPPEPGGEPATLPEAGTEPVQPPVDDMPPEPETPQFAEPIQVDGDAVDLLDAEWDAIADAVGSPDVIDEAMRAIAQAEDAND